jgi:hypothetical protein
MQRQLAIPGTSIEPIIEVVALELPLVCLKLNEPPCILYLLLSQTLASSPKPYRRLLLSQTIVVTSITRR